jgi:hypothetical protein
MGRKIYLPLVIILTFVFANAYSQTGEIKGRVIEKGGTEGVPFASVAALQGGSQVIATVTDIDGNYTLKPLSPGKYDVKVTSVGYSPSEKSNVLVTVDKTSYADVDLAKGIELKEVTKVEYVVPLIDQGSPSVQKTVTYEDIQTMPLRDVGSIASSAAGVGQADVGKELNIRGSRADATAYYVDGIKMRSTDGGGRIGGGKGVSNRSAEQVTAITGGIPAKYGDATGGVIITTTRDPSREYSGGIEISSSKFLDDYNNNTLSFDLSGPVYTKKDAEGKKTGQPMVGFFISGDGNYDGDPGPSAVGGYRVKPDLLKDIEAHPLVLNSSGGYYHRSVHFTLDSLEKIKSRDEVESKGFIVNGKLIFRPLKNFDVTLGGAYDYSNSRDFVRFYSLMNSENHGEIIDKNWHAYAKISQRFAVDEAAGKSASAIKRGYYSIQADYSQTSRVNQNKQHGDEIWKYGYVGQFTAYRAPIYQNDGVSRTYYFANGDSITGIYPTLSSYVDTFFTFSPSGLNPSPEAYTNEFYALTANGPRDNIIQLEDGSYVTASHYQQSIFTLAQNGGWVNGDNRFRPSALAYNIWATPGRIRTQYQKDQTNQFSIKAQGEADLKNHSISIGMEYEQRTDRQYSVRPTGLWDLARQLGNQNNGFNGNLDKQFVTIATVPGAYIAYDNGNGVAATNDTVLNYNLEYEPTKNITNNEANGFYENLRLRLGVPMNQYVDMDHLTPDFYQNSLDLFTPDQLIANFAMLPYYGYDYLGNVVSGKPSLESYYNGQVSTTDKNYSRIWGAFQPIYVAGYIQDAFDLNDIKFSIGLRVDRFDANQPSLVDQYLLYPAHTAGDNAVRNLAQTRNLIIPGNIGDDYVVYVNDYDNPSKILGYRNGDDWYDANGNSITDVQNIIAQTSKSGNATPFLIKPSAVKDTLRVMDLTNYGEGTASVFKDYEPQTTFMPRVAFSFPISDEANFKAHYDVLTQRPDDNVRFHPQDYMNIKQGNAPFRINNPNLKPQRTVDYEIQFEQRLTRSSAFAISVFYKEMRDMIEKHDVKYAFPVNYASYGNYDFGNAKGLTLTYDLRRTSNLRMDINYTLQFANGTENYEYGGTNVNALLSQYGYSDFVTPINLGFDERHRLVATIDYRYASGKDYNGPVWFGKQFLSNTGLNLQARTTSGRPYTRTLGYSHAVIVGEVNGSRKPWNFRIDAKLDKGFTLNKGTKTTGEKRKAVEMSVYLAVINLLDARNVLDVYTITGSAEDDGFIASPENQSQVSQQTNAQAFADLYYAYYNFDPGHWSSPRRIRLGAVISF